VAVDNSFRIYGVEQSKGRENHGFLPISLFAQENMQNILRNRVIELERLSENLIK